MARKRGLIEKFFDFFDFESWFFFGEGFDDADGGGFAEGDRDDMAGFEVEIGGIGEGITASAENFVGNHLI